MIGHEFTPIETVVDVNGHEAGVDFVGKRLDAQFRAPAMLPAFNNFCLSDRNPDEVFALTDARKGRILVEGRLSTLA